MASFTRTITLNGSFSVGVQIVKIFLTFFNRKIFIYYLGIFYVGVSSLFGNILNILSLAELGIGVAITCALYKPLAENSLGKVKAYMRLYAKIYHIVGVVIFGLGILIAPFLCIFLKDIPVTSEILAIYFLTLLGASISYFFSYRTSLIIAIQKIYVLHVIELISFAFLSLSQWLVLWLSRSIIFYLLVGIAGRLIKNLVITYFSNRMINLKNVTEIPLTAKEKQNLKKDTLGNVVNSIAAVIVFQTDSLLISYFAGVVVLGLYSNYVMVLNNVVGTLGRAMDSIVPSIGHLIADNQDEKVKSLHKKFLYWNFLITYLASIGFYALATDFITLWLGGQYALSPFYVFLITLSILVTGLRLPNLKFSDAYGLFARHKVKAILEALANLVLSLLLAGTCHLGLGGVILGTILSSILIAWWWEAIIVYRYGFKENPLNYSPLILKEIIAWLLGFGAVIFLSSEWVIQNNIWAFLLKGIVIFFALIAVFVIIYSRDNETKIVVGYLKEWLSKIR